MEKKLFRNEYDKVIAGVSSGLASYLQIDVTIVRLLFILSTLFLAGTGILVYIIMWIVVPNNPNPLDKFNNFYPKPDTSSFGSANDFNNPSNVAEQTKWNTPNVGSEFNEASTTENLNKMKKNSDTGRTITGLILLVLGVYFLLKQFDLLPHWLNIFKIYKLWPLAIIAIGVSLIFKNQRKTEWDDFKKATEDAQKAKSEQSLASDISSQDKDNSTTNV